MTTMKSMRVLCVDNDVHLLRGLERTLGRHFDVQTESDPARALDRLKTDAGFAAVISDMQMPGMLGTALLKEAKALQPATVRMLLTGHADLPTALSAVNDGFIFRLLVKPCPPLTMLTTVTEAVEQHRALTADRARADAVQRQLLQSERLATLGTLACGVGHEVNNLTSVLGGLVEAFEDAVRDGVPPLADDIAQLADVAKHMRAHGRQLLELGRPSSGVSERLDLREAVAHTLAMLATSGKTKRVAVALSSPEPAPLVLGQRTQLEQVVMNLVINAVDAMEGRREQKLTVTVTAQGSEASCAIADTGAGMPPEVQARMFEPFFTTKAPGKGTGLGMPVVRQIVEAHGGRLQVASRPNEGTTITFTLPAAASV